MADVIMDTDIVQHSVADTFKVNVPKKVTVKGLNPGKEGVPQVEHDYSFRRDLLRDFLAWWNFAPAGEGLMLTGPTGSGKSSLVLQAAARLNWPVQRITGHSRMEFADLVGRAVIRKDGSMGFEYGPLARAMKDGHIFLLDEIDMLDPGESAGMNGIVQGEPLTIPENGGEVIYPSPYFRFAATGNSKGAGDDGMYAGVSRQNQAFLDRFWMVVVGYPDATVEKKIIRNAMIKPEKDLINKFVQVAKHVRKQHQQGLLEITMSTRTLKRWAQMTEFFYGVSGENKDPVYYALDRAVLNRAEEDTRAGVHEIVQRIFDTTEGGDQEESNQEN